MIIISYIPKIQAMDKSIALISALQEEIKDLKVLYIFNLQKKNQIESCSFLLDLIYQSGAHAFVIDGSSLQDETLEIWSDSATRLKVITASENTKADPARTVFGYVKKSFHIDLDDATGEAVVLLMPRTGDENGLGNEIKALAYSKRAVTTVAYFKSVHDAGYGMSTNYEDTGSHRFLNLSKRLARNIKNKLKNAHLPQRHSKDTSFQDYNVDYFLCFNQSQKNLLLQYGYNPDRLFISGYPLLYPSWKTVIGNSSAYRNFKASDHDIVVFTRGETPDRPAHENIITNEMLLQMLDDIFSVVSEEFDEATIHIKPHPIQDVNVIKDFLDKTEYKGVRGSITYGAPSFLASISDYAISTYSSTVIDTMAFDVPTIEYLIENDFFRKKHPAGSPFPALGAIRANSKEELQKHIHWLKQGNKLNINLEKALGQQKDISLFSETIYSKENKDCLSTGY